jgi:hypothetical protein
MAMSPSDVESSQADALCLFRSRLACLMVAAVGVLRVLRFFF